MLRGFNKFDLLQSRLPIALFFLSAVLIGAIISAGCTNPNETELDPVNPPSITNPNETEPDPVNPPSISELLVSSTPADGYVEGEAGATNSWNMNNDIEIQFTQHITIYPGASIELRPVDITARDQLSVHTIEFILENGVLKICRSTCLLAADAIQDNKLTIPSDLFFRFGIRRAVVGTLELATEYEIFINGIDTDGNPNFMVGDNHINGRVITFRTRDVEPILVSALSKSSYDGLTGGVVFSGLMSEFQEAALREGEMVHNLEAVFDTLDGSPLTGEGIKVAMANDRYVHPGSEVAPAVVFRLQGIPAFFFPEDAVSPRVEDRPDSFYTHATQQVRYILNYAPGALIYDLTEPDTDLFRNPLIEELTANGIDDAERVYDTAIVDLYNLDIVNSSGSGFIATLSTMRNIQRLIRDEGVIYSKSLGNNIGTHRDSGYCSPEDQMDSDNSICYLSPDNTTNIIDEQNYSSRDVFLPYYYEDANDLETLTGAFVTLQAVVPGSSGVYRTIRSDAGDAMHYTLSILENGFGATSQATSTFSAIAAIGLEANQRYVCDFTPRQVIELLFETATDIGEPGVDIHFGHGLVNIEAFLARMTNCDAPVFQLYTNLNHIENLPELRDIGTLNQ